MNIVITGIGVISAIGNNVDENLISLKQQKTGINNIEYLDTIHKSDFLAGEVKLSNKQLLNQLNIPESESYKYTRTALLGIVAAKEALISAGLNKDDISNNTGFVSATTVGGMDKTEIDYACKNFDTSFIKTHPAGDSTNKIVDYLSINSYRTTLSTACSSSANAIIHGLRLIKNGFFDKVLVGGTDALSKFTLNGFNTLMILDNEYCKPFDKNRKGLNLGEGAGFIVLESLESAKKRNANIYCKLTGYANANDAFHQTASSPYGDGAYASMRAALKISGLDKSEIDYINTHGTGTQTNDLSEGYAIKRIFEDELPAFSSTKSYTGHTLGASAAIEAVFSILSIKHGLIFTNLHFSETISELNIIPQTYLIKKDIKNVLSNSFGFGGNNSTLIFSK